MSELEQIAAVLRSLGIRIEKISFTADAAGGPGPSDADAIQLTLNHKGRKYVRSYKLEEIESALITEPAAPPAAPSEQKRGLKGIISRTLTR